MSKRSNKSKTKTKAKTRCAEVKTRGPDQAQLRAVERLLETERYAEAVERLRPLIRRFPDHGSLRRMLVTALRHAKGDAVAAVAAFEWAEQRPGSLWAQETLLYFAMQAPYPMLADAVGARVRDLGAATPGLPLDEQEVASLCELPDGTTTDPQTMLQFDIGRLLLLGQSFAEAAQRLEGVVFIGAENNRATALFHTGEIEAARAAFAATWQRDADNLLALGWLAKLHLYQGDVDAARGLCAPLAATTARRVDDGIPQLTALLLLGEPEAAKDAWERIQASPGWETPASAGEALLCHLGACAAAAVGDRKQARRLWRVVAKLQPSLAAAAENLNAIERFGLQDAALAQPSVLTIADALPVGVVQQNVQHGATDRAASTLDDKLDVANAYLEAIYLHGDHLLRSFALFILTYRMRLGDDHAATLLRGFSLLPIGTPHDRYIMLKDLREAGRLAENEVEYRGLDGPTRLRLFDMEIHRERSDSGLPPRLDAQLEDAMSAYRAGQDLIAEDKLRALSKQVPDHPLTLCNLAAIRHKRGHSDEAKSLLRHAIEADGDYLFARCTLANLLIFDGDLDAAAALIDGQMARQRIHIQDLIALQGASAMLKSACGDVDGAHVMLEALDPLIANEDEAERLDLAHRSVRQVAPKGPLRDVARALWKGIKR